MKPHIKQIGRDYFAKISQPNFRFKVLFGANDQLNTPFFKLLTEGILVEIDINFV